MKVSRLLVATLFSAGCGSIATAQRPATPPAAPTPATGQSHAAHAGAAPVGADAAVIADFKARVDQYMALRKEALKDAPSLKESSDPGKIKAQQDAQSTKIRAARTTAKHGDVFTPAISAEFRRLFAPEVKGPQGKDAKEVLKDDAPKPGDVPLAVNSKYPDGAPVSTVPAKVLLNLPLIPAPLQYRMVGKHLVLLDEEPDVIVDYVLNVMP